MSKIPNDTDQGVTVSEAATSVARSWSHLIELLYADSWDQRIYRFRSPYVFRGISQANCDLTTRLVRLGRGRENLGALERHLLRNFRKYARLQEEIGSSVWNWLALAQHHGLHTRLLDWTFSPFVAMHFVTENLDHFDTDGAIWAVNSRETNRLIPKELRKIAEQAGSEVFTAEMLDEVAPTLEKFDSLAKEPFVVFLEPPSLDERIVNQFALFSLMSTPDRSVHEWLLDHPELVRRIVVPASLKWEVRDKLDQAGITERMLYPGLDGLARWLCRYYELRDRT